MLEVLLEGVPDGETRATEVAEGTHRAAARVAIGRAFLAGGEPLHFVVRGASMWPALRRGEVVQVDAARGDSARIGEVVVYRQGAVLLAHRIVATTVDAAGVRWLRCRGDTRWAAEGPLDAGEILGRVSHTRRQRGVRKLDGGWWRLWGRAMVRFGWVWAACFSLYRALRCVAPRLGSSRGAERRSGCGCSRGLAVALVAYGSLLSAGATAATGASALPRDPGPLTVTEVLAIVQPLGAGLVPKLRRAADRLLGPTEAERSAALRESVGSGRRAAGPPALTNDGALRLRRARTYSVQRLGAALLVVFDPDPASPPIQCHADLADKSFVIATGRTAGTVCVGLSRREKGRAGPNALSLVFDPPLPRAAGDRGRPAARADSVHITEYLAPPRRNGAAQGREAPSRAPARGAGRASGSGHLREYTLFRGVQVY
ncbi:MAG: S26 family signal peptidase [Proteobacteria bacterium]|nr:S26 family signal peptidase [Pseudomonadota bacterium]